MTYSELVKAVKKTVKTCNAKEVTDHLAVEFDVLGEAEGAFYVEFTKGSVSVEPYEYYDYDVRIRTGADTLLEIIGGKLAPEQALMEGRLTAEGRVDKLALFGRALKTMEAKQIAKKPEAKKITKRPAAKAIGKKPEAKAIGKKPEAKKLTAKSGK